MTVRHGTKSRAVQKIKIKRDTLTRISKSLSNNIYLGHGRTEIRGAVMPRSKDELAERKRTQIVRVEKR